jgi:hypothetical protein
MARNKAITEPVDTQHFTGVSAIWKSDGKDIDGEFQNAARALAGWNPHLADVAWDQESWCRHPSNLFFRTREALIGLVERWRNADWDSIEGEYNRMMAVRKRMKAARDAIQALQLALKSDDTEYRYLAHSILTAIEPKSQQSQPLDLPQTAALQGIKAYRQGLEERLKRPVWTAWIEWQKLPQPLPSKSTLAGVMFTNEILRYRNASPKWPSRNHPLSLQCCDEITLPWKAVAEFVALATGDVETDKELRTKVLNTWPNLARYYWPR